MQLKALRYFLMVASTGSFLSTARHFGVPASSVSRFIAALEKDLGQQLFYRSTRAVRLTDAGLQFQAGVRESLEVLDGAVDQVVGKSGSIQGLVRINSAEAMGRLHIARLVNKLQSQYPQLKVELTLTDSFIDPVQEGADITVRIGPLVDSGLIGRVVSKQHWLLAASPAYLKEHSAPNVPDDLKKHKCLLYSGKQGIPRWYFRSSLEQPLVHCDVDGPLQSNNSEVLLDSAIAGHGVVLFPTWLFDSHSFERGDLVSLLPEWDKSTSLEPSYIQMLSPENRLRSKKVSQVVQFLVDEIGLPPYWDKNGSW
ncbi:LysR family transcriptional regulator [Achromobacter spanius]|uniref:LysR family transcriptional regulator n=1 Tax=Achromobacter spanius TaxID=217203 RepID=UPI0036EFC932